MALMRALQTIVMVVSFGLVGAAGLGGCGGCGKSGKGAETSGAGGGSGGGGGGGAGGGGVPGAVQTLTLSLRQTTPADADPPKHMIDLVLEGAGAEPQGHSVEWQGACEAEDGGEAIVQVRCWWAGAGNVLTVIRQDDDLVVLHIELDEQAKAPPPTVAATLKLVPGAKLSVKK